MGKMSELHLKFEQWINSTKKPIILEEAFLQGYVQAIKDGSSNQIPNWRELKKQRSTHRYNGGTGEPSGEDS